ncbi:thioredoxin [Waddlia chondrophila]|uniref:Thioredoxin n=2 Tax=Waddlia chondrophila TaxID=71667 RepID=D6YS35_WADCW|nr:thioredoxin [Waddlia chondrophila]ADI38880.1 thioredoxin-related protein [Waddlia chondrophila WSU 86-1044]
MSGQIAHFNDDNFDSEITEGLTLVDFYADWCGPCRMMEPIIEELAAEFSGTAKIGKLDIEASQKTTSVYNVTSIPTMILFKDGNEVKRIVGVKDKDSLKEMISAEMSI